MTLVHQDTWSSQNTSTDMKLSGHGDGVTWMGIKQSGFRWLAKPWDISRMGIMHMTNLLPRRTWWYKLAIFKIVIKKGGAILIGKLMWPRKLSD